MVEPNIGAYKYKTNENLEFLFREGLGIKIGHPLSPNTELKLFFTNAIVGLKIEGGMQGGIKKDWQILCMKEFLKPIIELVNPSIIIAMGQLPFKSVCEVFEDKIEPITKKSNSFKNSVGKVFISENKTHIFPVYHCGSKGVNMNKKLPEQLEDWKKITYFETK